jgi:hypothetical protein
VSCRSTGIAPNAATLNGRRLIDTQSDKRYSNKVKNDLRFSRKNSTKDRKRFMINAFIGLFLLVGSLLGATTASAASEPQKLKIIYSSFTGAYTPLWLAVDERLDRKHGLDIEAAMLAGRGRTSCCLAATPSLSYRPAPASCRVMR